MSNTLSFQLAFRTFTRAFEFSGRSTRTEVVAFSLLSMLASVLNITERDSPPFGPLAVAGIIWSMIWAWPSLPQFVRRLHDQNRSGWWSMTYVIAALSILTLVMLPAGDGPISSATVHFGPWSRMIIWTPLTTTLWAVGIVSLLATLVLNFLPETPGDNRFGSDPRLEMPDEAIASTARI
ncbi:DUF805 domain-containing protein [Sphingomonas sp. ERG5]|uniref:DUF805 domain-containing protein n=1 Tax=Sphingomonas sp. ERG5 TaxID=1381597 RepID=UPI00054B6D4D|nr:DUF805 domain-containing protein [Sphingomonas sp. ERG5]